VRVTAGRGGSEPGSDLFLVLLSRLAQMGVQIDESGQEPFARSVDHARVFGALELASGTRAETRESAIFDHGVGLAIELPAGIDGARILDDQKLEGLRHGALLSTGGSGRAEGALAQAKCGW